MSDGHPVRDFCNCVDCTLSRTLRQRDDLHAALARLETFLPTAEQINALPAGIKKYIHDLESDVPDGLYSQNILTMDQNRQLEALAVDLQLSLATEQQEVVKLKGELAAEREKQREDWKLHGDQQKVFMERIASLERERDEARAEVERLRTVNKQWVDENFTCRKCDEAEQQLSTLTAELEKFEKRIVDWLSDLEAIEGGEPVKGDPMTTVNLIIRSMQRHVEKREQLQSALRSAGETS